jgi:hypothetical protein
MGNSEYGSHHSFALLEWLSGGPGATKEATVRPPVAAVEMIECPAMDPATHELLARGEFRVEPSLKEPLPRAACGRARLATEPLTAWRHQRILEWSFMSLTLSFTSRLARALACSGLAPNSRW